VLRRPHGDSADIGPGRSNDSRECAARDRSAVPGRTGLTSLDRIRRRRNQAEYPEPDSYDLITVAEVEDAIRVASDCPASAHRLLDLEQLGIV